MVKNMKSKKIKISREGMKTLKSCSIGRMSGKSGRSLNEVTDSIRKTIRTKYILLGSALVLFACVILFAPILLIQYLQLEDWIKTIIVISVYIIGVAICTLILFKLDKVQDAYDKICDMEDDL